LKDLVGANGRLHFFSLSHIGILGRIWRLDVVTREKARLRDSKSSPAWRCLSRQPVRMDKRNQEVMNDTRK